MILLKRTYTLPEETVRRLEQRVGCGGRSALLADLIREWLDQQERESLRGEIIEGCREMAETDVRTEREWQSVEKEQWRATGV